MTLRIVPSFPLVSIPCKTTSSDREPFAYSGDAGIPIYVYSTHTKGMAADERGK